MSQSFEVVKYHYQTSKTRATRLLIAGGRLFYESRRRRMVEIADALGCVYGPRTTTFRKAKTTLHPWRCVSFVLRQRTYDFELKSASLRDVIALLSTQQCRPDMTTVRRHCARMQANRGRIDAYPSVYEWWAAFEPPAADDPPADDPPADGPSCSVCLEEAATDPRVLPCGHVFCGACIRQWLTRVRSCPNCRRRA